MYSSSFSGKKRPLDLRAGPRNSQYLHLEQKQRRRRARLRNNQQKQTKPPHQNQRPSPSPYHVGNAHPGSLLNQSNHLPRPNPKSHRRSQKAGLVSSEARKRRKRSHPNARLLHLQCRLQNQLSRPNHHINHLQKPNGQRNSV